MKSGSPEGQMVADMIKNGQIVPSHVGAACGQPANVHVGHVHAFPVPRL